VFANIFHFSRARICDSFRDYRRKTLACLLAAAAVLPSNKFCICLGQQQQQSCANEFVSISINRTPPERCDS